MKQISNKNYEFLKEELKGFVESKTIDKKQYDEMMDSYEVTQKINQVMALLIFGAIFTGLGILIFISGNWYEMSKILRLSILILGFVSTSFAGWHIRYRFPRTSSSLNYIAVFIFGASLILIDQMWVYLYDETVFLVLWAVVAMIFGVIYSDKLIYLFSQMLMFMYLMENFEELQAPFTVLIAVSFVFFIDIKREHSKIVFFANMMLCMLLIGSIFENLNGEAVYYFMFMFVIGFLIKFIKYEKIKNDIEFWGNLITGFAGVMLTIEEMWEDAFNGDFLILTIIIAVLFTIYLLYTTKRGSVTSVIFIAIMIFRYYVDAAYEFMPKSMFFIVSGLILVALGFWMERAVRKIKEENKDLIR